MRLKKLLGLTLAGIGMPIVTFGGAALHLWTTYIAFETGKFLLTAITFAMPPFSEMYWFVSLWNEVGFWNWYGLAVMFYTLAALSLWAGITLFEQHTNEESANRLGA
jgi:hypothetical protein